ncbi:MAG: TIR domain-containing protein [Anaerolineales bacterium]|nr:TIR domain-containing protein [Anaerolineales bacterium]
MSHIFISYSRKDFDFAQKIVTALAANNLDTWIDWKSIPKGEDWEQEIYRGIEEADAFLFLISPDSVASEMCNKEIAHAVKNGKRILPIVIRDADLKSIHPEISKRNWIFCRDEQDDFNKAIEETRKTIHTDYEWLKYHTELQVKALKWERKKDNSRLLRGKELQEAEKKLSEISSQEDPQPTPLQREYILVSGKHEDRQRRQITIGLSLGLLILVVISVIAWGQRNIAISETNAKATALVNEENARATAQAEKEHAEQQARIARSRELAAQAQNTTEFFPQRGLLLALEASNTLQNIDSNVPYVETTLRSKLKEISGVPVGERMGDLFAIAYSPDERWLAFVGEKVQLVDLKTDPLESIVLSEETWSRDVAFSPDGQWLASGSGDGVVLLWDMYDLQKPPFHLDGHENSISGLSFSPDGHWLVSGEIFGSVINLWNMLDLEAKPVKLGVDGGPYQLIFSPNGKNLAFTSGYATLLWDMNTLQSDPVILDGEGYSIFSLAFSPDGRWLATAGSDDIMRMWDLENMQFEPILGEHASLSPLLFSPDGRWLAGSRLDGFVQVLDLDDPNGHPIILDKNGGVIFAMAFSPNGNWLASGSQNKIVHLWDMRNLEAEPVALEEHKGSVDLLAFSPDEQWLASGSIDNTVRLWNMDKLETAPLILNGYEGDVNLLEFSLNGNWLASGSSEVISGGDEVRLWKIPNLNSEPLLIDHLGSAIEQLVYSSNDQWLAIGVNDPQTLWPYGDYIKLFDTKINQMTSIDYGKEDTVVYMQPSNPYGRLIPIHFISNSGIQQEVKLWDRNNPLANLIDISQAYFSVTTSLNAPVVAWSVNSSRMQNWVDSSGVTQIWNVEENKSDAILIGTFGGILTLSPDTRWLTMQKDDDIFLWDLLDLSSDPVTMNTKGLMNQENLFFSPNGNWLATVGNRESVVLLWNLQTPQLDMTLLKIKNSKMFVTEPVFSLDGRWMAISNENSILVWDFNNLTSEPTILSELDVGTNIFIFSPDSHWLASGGYGPGGYGVRVWDLTNMNSSPVFLSIIQR